MSTGRCLIFAALATVSAGCTAARLPAIAYDVPAHHVVRVGPYAITTDFPIDRKDPILQELLSLRTAVNRELELPPSREIVRIVIFQNQQSYDDFFRRNFADLPPRRALFVKQTDGQMAVFTFRGEKLCEDLRHETTHALLHSTVGPVPLWLDEGIAEYFEAPQGEPTRPEHTAALLSYCERGWKPDLERLEGLRDLWQMNAADYRESWLWVHFCLRNSDETRKILRAHLKETAVAMAKTPVASGSTSSETTSESGEGNATAGPNKPVVLSLSSRLNGIAVDPKQSVLAHLESLRPDESLAEIEILPEPAHPQGRKTLSRLLMPWGN